MTSIITQNIASAVASSDTSQAQRQQQPVSRAGSIPTHAQVAQVSQASSQQASTQVKNDKERSAQIPKRTEAGFSSQEEKEREENKMEDENQKDESGTPKKTGLNVIA